MQKHTRWIGLTGAIVIALAGFWIGRQQVSTRVQAQQHDSGVVAATSRPMAASAPAGELARSVQVVTPRREPMARYLSVPATMEAYEKADLYAKASGYISEVRVDIGDVVKEGDVLAIIDVPEMRKELSEAEALHMAALAEVKTAESKIVQADRMLDMAKSLLQRAQAELALRATIFERRKDLFKAEAITQEQLDEAQNQFDVANADEAIAQSKVAVAEADVASAHANRAAATANIEVARARADRIKTLMKYAEIVAPFDGIVIQRLIDRGTLVQSATTNRTAPLFTLHRTDMLRISIEAPETDIEFIRPGSPAKIRPYSLSDVEVTGTIARVASSLKTDTRTMRAEIDLPNADGRLMSGMYAHIVIEIDQQANALTIPASSLLTEGHEVFVYTVVDGRAQRTPITLGLDNGIRVQVAAGLDDGAQVVVTGKGLITDGALLRPVPMDEHSL